MNKEVPTQDTLPRWAVFVTSDLTHSLHVINLITTRTTIVRPAHIKGRAGVEPA